MTDNRIEVGDLICVTIPPRNEDLFGIVEYIPCATGDSWIIKAVKTKDIVHINTFYYITLVKKAKVIKND